jgi:hypothetical protein
MPAGAMTTSSRHPKTGMKSGIKSKELRIEVYALYLAYRDPRTPWLVRISSGGVYGEADRLVDPLRPHVRKGPPMDL